MMQAIKLGDFEGLVFTTARMFASQVKMEEEDLRQELRIRVWRAVETYDASKTRVPLKNYVYGCVTNKIKDYKRNAARRAVYGVEFEYIEEKLGLSESPTTDAFVGEYMAVAHDDVYGCVDDLFALPTGVTRREGEVLVLLMWGMSNTEVQLRLSMSRTAVLDAIDGLRAKLADWKPGLAAELVIELDLVAVAA